MRLLTINSTGMYEDKKSYYIYKETGRLLNELSLTHEVENLHFAIPFEANDGMANYDLKRTSVKITVIKRRHSKLLNYIVAYFKSIRRLLSNDFLYLFYPNSFFPVAFFAIILNKPFALYLRGQNGIFSTRSIYLYKKAKFILTVSPQFTAAVLKYNNSTETIKPMIEYSTDDIVNDRVYANKQVYNFLYVGRIEAAKGVFELLEAYNILVTKGINNIRLAMIGDGESLSEINDYIRKHALNDYITLYGPIYDKERLKQFYRDADAFVFPTHHEGFPRVLYEAMIFGSPIITTFVDSISYIMKDTVNCFQIEPKSFESIVNKIEQLISNYPDNAQIAKNATQTITDYLNTNNESHCEKINRLILSQEL